MSSQPASHLTVSFIILKSSVKWNRSSYPERLHVKLNGDSQSTNERVPFLVGSFGLSCQHKRFLFCLALGCSSWPSTKIFFPHRTLFQFLCLHRPASWAGSRAGSPVSWFVSLFVPCREYTVEECTPRQSPQRRGFYQNFLQ
jgi:hypothetical protein